jgi:Holliday junction DNA helicase RuvA
VNNKNKEIELFIYHNITDNSQALYGFLTREEKEIFEELIKISGVG